MNQEELENLINRLSNLSTELNIIELEQLRKLKVIREASRNTGSRPNLTYNTYSNRYEPKSRNNQETRGDAGITRKKLTVGDKVRVTRGRNQGVTATIIREAPAQFELKSEQVVDTFRKWKNNVKKVKNANE